MNGFKIDAKPKMTQKKQVDQHDLGMAFQTTRTKPLPAAF